MSGSKNGEDSAAGTPRDGTSDDLEPGGYLFGRKWGPSLKLTVKAPENGWLEYDFCFLLE